MKTEILMVRDGGVLRPYTDIDWDIFKTIEAKKPVLVTLHQPRNPDHHRKLWKLATVVANFDPIFRDAEDVVRWLKRHIPWMHKRYKGRDGSMIIELESISFASMDQTKFNALYERAMELLTERLGCNPETLLEQIDEPQR